VWQLVLSAEAVQLLSGLSTPDELRTMPHGTLLIKDQRLFLPENIAPEDDYQEGIDPPGYRDFLYKTQPSEEEWERIHFDWSETQDVHRPHYQARNPWWEFLSPIGVVQLLQEFQE
jgi:hypothetical protein